jgi:chromosomal replication initiation ATPase DnaA
MRNKINKKLLDSLTDIPNSRYDKNKATCEFILLCIQKLYGYDTTYEVLQGSGKKVRYREAKRIVFYLIKYNTGLPFREISKQLGTSHSENVWKAYNDIADLRKSKIRNDTTDKVEIIQGRLDEYIKLCEQGNK